MRSKLISLALLALAGLLLGSCPKKSATSGAPSSNIEHFRMGTHDVYIPRAYIRFAGTIVTTQGALIHTLFPGAMPIPGDEKDLWRTGRSQEFIMVHFTDLSTDKSLKYNLDEQLKWRVERYKASMVRSEQYGLIYQTQPANVQNDFDELWLERKEGRLVSLISCGKKYADGVVPHCDQLLRHADLAVTITFDKRKLPQWQTITANVTDMLDSFRSEDRSKNFLNKQLANSLSNQAGGQK